jgi:hypothetical protein
VSTNVIKNGAHCSWGLTTLSGEVNERFIALLSLFDRTQCRVGGEKADQLTRNVTLTRRRGCLQVSTNAIKNGAYCNWGLTTLPGEVNVRLIALLRLFDRTPGRVGGEKADQLTWNITSIRRRGFPSGEYKRD